MRVRLLLAGLLGFSGSAGAQWVTVDFQDPIPFTMQWSGGSRDLGVMGAPGPCANGVAWNFTRVGAEAGNGGYRDRGYARYTWCSYNTSRMSMGPGGWTESGVHFRPASGWPSTFFGRFRIFVEQPIRAASGGDVTRQAKFFMWHTDVFDGDQRVIGYLENGANCGRSDTNYVCFTLQRNISHHEDTATVALPVGQWSHLQFSWRHGALGTSYVKIWLNNNEQSTPTAEDLQLDSAPTVPGGTAWIKDDRGYDAQFFFGNSANTGTMFSNDFVVRLMDFQLDGSFNPNWSPAVIAAIDDLRAN
jgi:hypothetical protein